MLHAKHRAWALNSFTPKALVPGLTVCALRCCCCRDCGSRGSPSAYRPLCVCARAWCRFEAQPSAPTPSRGVLTGCLPLKPAAEAVCKRGPNCAWSFASTVTGLCAQTCRSSSNRSAGGWRLARLFPTEGAGLRAADDAADDDDDALVSLHTCCEAISEARFWSSAAFSVLGTVSVKRGWGHSAMLSALSLWPPQCHDLCQLLGTVCGLLSHSF